MDFPKFDGTDAISWVKKTEKFFKLNPFMDPKFKVDYAALYLEGDADNWYQTIQETKPLLTWEMFTGLLLQRFSTGSQENLIGKFNKLMQTSSVEAYISQFEELRSHLLATNKLLTEDFYVASFLSGLRKIFSRHFMSTNQTPYKRQ